MSSELIAKDRTQPRQRAQPRANRRRSRSRRPSAALLQSIDDRSERWPLWSAQLSAPTDESRNALVESYRALVLDIVGRFARRLPPSVDRGDLETAGSVGLMSAVTSYDPSRGVCFTAYSRRRVRGALLDELRQQDWLPRAMRQRVESHKRTVERLSAVTGREPFEHEVADAMGLDRVQYGQLFGQLFGTGLPGTGSSGNGASRMGSGSRAEQVDGAAARLEVVADTRSATPDERIGRDELLELVAERLTEQEYRVVYLKYWEELPMREIGELMQLSESRVCKIHLALIERLRERLGARG